MATVTLSTKGIFDMSTLGVGPGGGNPNNLTLADVATTTTTWKLTFSDGSYDLITGTGFTFTAYLLTGGTVTSWRHVGSDKAPVLFTGLNISAADFVANVVTSNNPNAAGILTGDDTITGGTGQQLLVGGAGNDIIKGGPNTNIMEGGTGDDTYIVDYLDPGFTLDQQVVENAGEGSDTVKTSLATLTVISNVENYIYTGKGNWTFDDSSILANTKLVGNAGNDVLIGGGTNGTTNILDGGAGADQMTGGHGDDTYFVDNVGDKIASDTGGDDIIQSSITVDLAAAQFGGGTIEDVTLTGTAAINATGTADVNTLTGNNAANILDGQGGKDTMMGYGGNDTYKVDNAGDSIIEFASGGIDTVISTAATYTLADYVEKLTLDKDAGNINGTGNGLVNTITGNAGNNTLDGGTGADILTGGAGNDTYVVDNAGDKVVETGPNTDEDTVQASITFSLAALASVENLTLIGSNVINATGNAGVNVLTGNGADNILDGGAGADTMIGGVGNDTYIVDNAGDTITEGSNAGNDTVKTALASIATPLYANVENYVYTGKANWTFNGSGSSLADLSITGGAGNDILTGNANGSTLNGGAGADQMTGGAGDDTYFIDNAGDKILADTGGNDTVVTAFTVDLRDISKFAASGIVIENATLTGTAALNATGTADDNKLTGNAGNNTLDGLGGADIMAGGLGNDTYQVDDAGDTVTEVANGGTDLVISSVSFTLGQFVENLTLKGAQADDLQGTGNALNNIITGDAGDNFLNGGDGNDTLIGNDGADEFSGGAGIDNLQGGAGSDTLDGEDGADIMTGGADNDLYFVDNVGDKVVEAAGDAAGTGDEIILQNAFASKAYSYTIVANVENLDASALNFDATLTGNAQDNKITTGAGDDTLNGGAGKDILIGGAGDDTYIVDNVDDVVQEDSNKGNDTVKTSVAGELFANVENYIYTGKGTWTLDAHTLATKVSITGGAGVDTLTGGSGDDTLDGGAGNDVLVGGGGNDTYIVDSVKDTITDSAGTDTVQSAKLSIDLTNTTLYANMENAKLTGTAALNLTGNAGDNVLTGNDGANKLSGGAGDDILSGGGGNDTLNAGTGTDKMTGGAGNDDFVFDTLDATNVITITDFTKAGDKLGFGGITDVAHDGILNDIVGAIATIDDAGAGNDVTITFNSGASLVLSGVGTGSITSITQLVSNSTTQLHAG